VIAPETLPLVLAGIVCTMPWMSLYKLFSGRVARIKELFSGRVARIKERHKVRLIKFIDTKTSSMMHNDAVVFCRFSVGRQFGWNGQWALLIVM
jgi:hypothetical protein